ncbi:hypothetical protein ARMGADRAFT_1082714 [Armillaria gallica]|uniref:MYND-type domain-containing protein n=1 Tax=Armillaria gallica TaxID=47427 RepID=A0A2H3D5D2_ARMGA|nr:hypothetical protein ARMGADRAFT_1082714 [Armillaria gallica]
MHIVDICIISCQEEIHLDTFEHALLVSYLLRLLAVLSTESQIHRDMAGTPNFLSTFTRAWMCLIAAHRYRLTAMMVIKRFVPLNETAFISSIDSYANQLPLSALLSLEEEFSGHDTEYTILHCVLHSVHQIIHGSRRESVFCTTFATIWVLRITKHLSHKCFACKRVAGNPDSKIKCNGALRCLADRFAFFASLVGRMKYIIVADVLCFGLLKVILCSETLFRHLSEFPQVQEARTECVQSWKTIFTKLRGFIVWLPVLRQFLCQRHQISDVDTATLDTLSQGQWLPLVDVAERYISLYKQIQAKCVCNMCGDSECLMACLMCQNTFYCSAECQKLDYRSRHKEGCKKYESFASEDIKPKYLAFFTKVIVDAESQGRMVEIAAGGCEFAQKAGVAV